MQWMSEFVCAGLLLAALSGMIGSRSSSPVAFWMSGEGFAVSSSPSISALIGHSLPSRIAGKLAQQERAKVRVSVDGLLLLSGRRTRGKLGKGDVAGQKARRRERLRLEREAQLHTPFPAISKVCTVSLTADMLPLRPHSLP